MQKWICIICGFVYDGEESSFASTARIDSERPAMDGRAGAASKPVSCARDGKASRTGAA